MTDAAQSGEPYPSDAAGPVDAWSQAVYTALRDWHVARQGDWTRREPGYLPLTISRVDGRDIEPIVLHTADAGLTVSFGHWETHNPAPYELGEAEADVIAEHAKLLVGQWLNGEMRTAVVTDETGRWRGTTTIELGELSPQLEAAARWARDFHPKQVEVRTPTKRDWQSYPIESDSLKPPVLSPHRLPG